MSIQDLGAIGELVGAAAVVVTLVYLARQIRENSRQVRVSSITSINQLINEGFDPIYNSQAYSEIWFRGLESRELLDDFQRNLFDFFMARLMNSFCTALVQYQNDTLDETDFQRYVGVYRGIVASEGGRQWLQEIGRDMVGEEAAALLEAGKSISLISSG
jgi:hypothetical protein